MNTPVPYYCPQSSLLGTLPWAAWGHIAAFLCLLLYAPGVSFCIYFPHFPIFPEYEYDQHCKVLTDSENFHRSHCISESFPAEIAAVQVSESSSL